MPFLPIVERELRVAARRRGTYGMRMRNAGLATFAFVVCFLTSQFAPAIPFGKTFFWGVAGLCMFYCLAAGRMMTADCLSGEKREGTLGLLFLTDLKGYDVVLGKLFASSLDGFYGLLAVFPLLAIPLLSGGMTNGELWRTALVLVNTFLFSLAIGLFVSSICRDHQKAMAGNFGLILLLSGVLPAFEGGRLMAISASRPMVDGFFYSCPVYSLLLCGDVPYKSSASHFWWSIVITFILTILLVLLACRLAPSAWQDKPISSRGLKRKQERRRRWWREGRLEKADAFRRRLLDMSAYFWLAARSYLKVTYVWICVLCMGILWIVTTVNVGHKDDAANFSIAFLLNGMLKLWIITEAGHQLAEDKRSGAFELLLSTPLTVADIVRGQWLALRWQFLKPVVVAVIAELVLMMSIGHIRTQEDVVAWCTWSAGIVMFVADVVTVGWVAMSAALTGKNHDRATLKTAALVLALPWILFGAVALVTHVWRFMAMNSNVWEPGWTYYLGWWFGIGLCMDFVLLFRARRRLQRSFRQIALEPAAAKSRISWFHGRKTASAEHQATLRVKLRRLGFASVVLLAAATGAVVYLRRSLAVHLPDPVVVSITQSNHPVQMFCGQGGFLFILPDGSLWRWSREPQITQPRPIGTNRDWVQASMMNPIAAGIRSDGTLWAWRSQDEVPIQVGTDRDWMEVRATEDSIMARKRDGTLWSRGKAETLGNGSDPIDKPQKKDGRPENGLVQVGTNHDWKGISTGASSARVLALRADGTLWTWGEFGYYVNGFWARTNFARPIQICQESNWVDFTADAWSTARNQAGEQWTFFPFRGLPGEHVAVTAIAQLAPTNVTVTAFGPFFSNDWTWASYEIQPGGTMWANPLTTWPPSPSSIPPLRFGQRADWAAVWGRAGTLIGLASDGTLWTWGIDYGQERHYDFSERVNLVRAAVSNAFTPNRNSSYEDWGGRQPQKEPRPLLRLVYTNSVKNNSR
jgi:alpha-tubulin suppressor-like RCC1 family protein